ELGEDRPGVRRIHRRHPVGGLVAHEEAVIVRKARELADAEAHLLYIAPMRREVSEVRGFYDTRLGALAVEMVARKLSDAWGSTRDLDVLGVGYATPWLGAMPDARRVIAAMPFGQGAETWPGPRN